MNHGKLAHPSVKPVPVHWANPIRQAKLDGIRTRVIAGEYPILWTRTGNDIADKLAGMQDPGWKLLAGSVFDCELIMADGSSPMAVISGKSIDQDVHLYVFDVLEARGHSIRIWPLCNRIALLHAWNSESALPAIMSPIPEVSSYEHAIGLGYEGIVTKDRYSAYGVKDSWRKQKQLLSHDARIMNTKPGKGKYEGMIGSILLQVIDAGKDTGIYAWSSGFSDADRLRLTHYFQGKTAEQISAMGVQVEVQAQSMSAHKRLRHPRVIRIRWDLTNSLGQA